MEKGRKLGWGTPEWQLCQREAVHLRQSGSFPPLTPVCMPGHEHVNVRVAHTCPQCTGNRGSLETQTRFCVREGGRRGEVRKEESLFFPSACPAGPQSATGCWQQELHAIPTLACRSEKGVLSLAQPLVPRVPRRAARRKRAHHLRCREMCLICHRLPAIFLVSGQEESKSHHSRQTQG